MKNKALRIIVIASVSMFLTACGNGDKQNSAADISETHETTESVYSDIVAYEFTGLSETIPNKETETETETGSGIEISVEDALECIVQKYGSIGSIDKSTGNEISYAFEDIQEINGKEYYNFKYSWLVHGENGEHDRVSQIGNIFVSMDASTVSFAEKFGNVWRLCETKAEVVGIFSMQKDGKKDAVSTLILNSDYTFQFSYDAFSSYLPYGYFEKEDNKIICRTIDGLYKYTFDIVDENTLSFNEGESSEIRIVDENFAKPKHGSLFKTE